MKPAPTGLPTRARVPGRSAARAGLFAAVGFLLLDAILLALAGVWMDRPSLIFWGILFAAGAACMPLVWRRYLAHLGELDQARRAMREEVEDLRGTLRNGRG